MTDPSETTITMEARAQIAAGFQRLMAYRRGDGSFAAETGDDAVGDPWYYSDLKPYVCILPSGVQSYRSFVIPG